MHITTLIDNSEGQAGLTNEWGLSLHLEANGRKILFDTGSTSAFASNAQKLNIDLRDVEAAVLSHGHYDHGGGLGAFFSANDDAPLYLRTTADGDHYYRMPFIRRYIGLDKNVLQANGGRLRWLSEDTEVAPGIHALTSIPSTELQLYVEKKIMVKEGERLVPDAFKHELALVVKESDGISVMTGCGHLGVLNMVQAAKAKWPDEPIKAVIGGFHAVSNPITKGMASSPSGIEHMAERFKVLGCQRVISGHCTGKKASAILKKVLKDDHDVLATGKVFDI